MAKYNPAKIEKKWQKYWDKEKLYEAGDFSGGKKNFMLLVEFPYPSGDLHTGHWYAFAVPDIYGRYLRMSGFNVMYPIGFDAFGLPAENAAIKNNIHPRDWTKKNIVRMSKQLRSMGAGFDWSREVQTIDPEYYKWTQWIFIQLYKAGLAYRAETLVNWCPKDKTVLANEQVIDGKCDRCSSDVEQRNLSQWMFKTTSFADRLIDDLQDLDWPESTKLAQINWIGRSEGAKIKFKVPGNSDDHTVEVFTTRPDTIFGATFLVVSPELAQKWVGMGWVAPQDVKDYIAQSLKKTELQRQEETKDKTGVYSGFNAINPMTEKEIPIWISDYVLGNYGTGAIMAVPAHDERDYDFAKKFNLPIKEVVLNEEKFIGQANTKEGVLISSGMYDGMSSEEAKKKITQALKEKGHGELHKNYRLHDWVLSRQRYWGVPIPMIKCADCGYNPVPETELPVELPPLKDFMPADDGRSPLAKAGKWLKVKCPKCGKDAERETDTMDTFVDSSWYYMRYTDPKNEEVFASQANMAKWLPLPLYFGGSEHNTMHLLYSRFITKALRSQNLVDFSEPFLGRRNHGFIFGPDGQKMSKSKGNVVDPDEQVEKFGADTIRTYFAFMGPYDQNYNWNFDGVLGVRRFLDRFWNFVQSYSDKKLKVSENAKIKIVLNRAVKEIADQIKSHKFNTGVSHLMKLLNALDEERAGAKLSKEQYESMVKLIAPYAPHMAEELWMKTLGNESSVHVERWPEFDEALLLEESISLVIQVNGKFRDTISAKRGLSEEEVKVMVLANEKVKKEIEGKEIKKFVYVQDKLTNIVV
ncbi:MAG: leucine--tRNA ligase [Candidatus Pacebacteria bacterium]|nr:leucine--tRNA ligase [Candidatus Paceibacterota bacterium]